MKALLYRIGGLGDSLLTYPILEILSKKGYEITVWGNPEYFSLAKKLGFCKKITFYEPKDKFDLALILSSQRENFSFYADSSTYIKPVPDEKIWVVDYYLKKLNLENENFSKNLSLYISEKKKSNLCIIHPGSGSKNKNPEESFFIKLERLLEKIGYEVLYILGPAEIKLSKKYTNSIYFEDPVEIAKNLIKASLYIGLDSGISHLSSYIGIPSIVIFGPTDPYVWHPIGENLYLIRYEKCPPCFPNICKQKECLQTDFLINQIEQIFKIFLQKYQII